MFAKLINFMKPLPDAERLTDEKQIKRLYRNWRIKMFLVCTSVMRCSTLPVKTWIM